MAFEQCVHSEYQVECFTQRSEGMAQKILARRVNEGIGWRAGAKRDFSTAQTDAFADERGEKASA
jgi:hypothetical protein